MQTREDVISGNIFRNSHPEPTEPRYGDIRMAAEIGGWAHAVGSCGMVYRFDSLSDWTRIDDGLSEDFNARAIHGSGISDLYVAGSKGEIRHFDGSSWSEVESLTKENLTCVKCVPDKTVYIGGYRGTLLQGQNGKFKLIDSGKMTDDIWDLEWFNDKLYVSTMHGIYMLEGENLLKLILEMTSLRQVIISVRLMKLCGQLEEKMLWNLMENMEKNSLTFLICYFV